MDDIELAELKARIMQRFEAALQEELAAIAGSVALPSARSVDPVAYWLNNWPPRPGECDPTQEKLWLTKGRAETALKCGKTKIDELIRNYDIAVDYGGRKLINRYRGLAAMHGDLPRRAKTGVSG